jgi:hypothetical protein
VQHPCGGTRRGPRRRRRLAEAAECRPQEGGDREHGRLAPQDLRRRDRRQGHRLDLDVGTRLITVDLQEHVTDAQGRALAMGDDDLDLFQAGQYRGMTTDVAPGLSRATARLAASRYPAASCTTLCRDTQSRHPDRIRQPPGRDQLMGILVGLTQRS